VKTSDFRDQFGVNQWMEQSRVITSLDFRQTSLSVNIKA